MNTYKKFLCILLISTLACSSVYAKSVKVSSLNDENDPTAWDKINNFLLWGKKDLNTSEEAGIYTVDIIATGAVIFGGVKISKAIYKKCKSRANSSGEDDEFGDNSPANSLLNSNSDFMEGRDWVEEVPIKKITLDIRSINKFTAEYNRRFSGNILSYSNTTEGWRDFNNQIFALRHYITNEDGLTNRAELRTLLDEGYTNAKNKILELAHRGASFDIETCDLSDYYNNLTKYNFYDPQSKFYRFIDTDNNKINFRIKVGNPRSDFLHDQVTLNMEKVLGGEIRYTNSTIPSDDEEMKLYAPSELWQKSRTLVWEEKIRVSSHSEVMKFKDEDEERLEDISQTHPEAAQNFSINAEEQENNVEIWQKTENAEAEVIANPQIVKTEEEKFEEDPSNPNKNFTNDDVKGEGTADIIEDVGK